VCAPVRAEEGLLGVLCPRGSSTAYRDLPEDASIGGYLSPAQIDALAVDPAALDAEGRCLVLEFPAFVLFGVYSPANSNGLRDEFRHGFLCALDIRIRNLTKMGKRVILTGDLNVSREEIDTARAEEAIRQEGLTRDDYLNAPNRRVFNQLLEHGKVPGERDPGRERPVLWDLCREFHPDRQGMYTHWEQRINARPGNFGSRIDYILCSIEMKTWFAEANIQEGLMGSDHCPVYASTNNVVDCRGEQVHIADLMNPAGMFKDGIRLRDFDPTQDLLPLSGKLLPEFSKRRTIKDMFSGKASTTKTPSSPTKTDTSDNKAPPPTNTSDDSPHPPPTPAGASIVSSQPESTKRPTATSEKRRAPSSRSSKPTKKKTKTKPSSQQSTLGSGQKSLERFFAPKPATTSSATDDIIIRSPPPPTGSATGEDTRAATLETDTLLLPASSQTSSSTLLPASQTSIDSQATTSTTTAAPVLSPSSSFIDPEASKESWVKLFSKKKPPPRCESHAEPCISLTTKKPGINCGRRFWVCAR